MGLLRVIKKEDHNSAKIVQILNLNKQIKFVSLMGVDLGGNATDEKIPVELFKKEMDDNSRTVSGFNELKDYIKNYPYSMKYNIDDAEVQEIASKVIEDWTRQYKELSNFVHGTNSNFFQKTEYLDEFKFIKKDVNFLTKQVEVLSSIVNTLLIIFYFEEYIKFDETTEKSLIRSAISNNMEYKKKIVEVLKEI